MQEKFYGELVTTASEMKAVIDLLLLELDKSKWASEDLSVEAVRRRTQKYVGEIGHALENFSKTLSSSH